MEKKRSFHRLSYCSFVITLYVVFLPHIISNPVLIVGGNYTLNNVQTNLAHFDLATRSWSSSTEPRLYLYGATTGVVLDVIVRENNPYDDLYVVGAFDTTCMSCQAQYCSIGHWKNNQFLRVGEGLCTHGDQNRMKVITAELGNGNDLFVGGAFESLVWSGSSFEKIYNIARYASEMDAWLPLVNSGGGLTCTWCIPNVLTLAWDKTHEILYIGGKFDSINNVPTSCGLAMWQNSTGLVGFPGGGLSLQDLSLNGVATALVYDASSDSLFVAGVFMHIGTLECKSLARWRANRWNCLYTQEYSFDLITTMVFMKNYLYVAGMPAFDSSWDSATLPYMVARYNEVFVSTDTGPVGSDYVSKPHGNMRSRSRKRNRRLLEELGLQIGTNSTNEHPPRPLGIKRARSEFYRGLLSLGLDSNDSSLRQLVKLWLPSERVNRRHMASNGGSWVPPDGTTNTMAMWSWLPGFDGANGVITRVGVGFDSFEGGIFVAGLFTNYEPVVVWMPSPDPLKLPPTTSSLGKLGQIGGDVLAIGKMTVQPPEVEVNVPYHDMTWVVVLVCVFLGILLGIFIAFLCHYHTHYPFFKVPPADELGLPYFDPNFPESEVNFPINYQRAIRLRHLEEPQNLNIIDPKDIVLSSIIGEGSFGRVWSGVWRASKVAVKEFVFAQAAVQGGALQRNDLVQGIIGEAAIMSVLRHPKILHLYGCSITTQALWIVSELCSKGSLRQVLGDRRTRLSTRKRLKIAIDVSEGMNYLHTHTYPIVHRDLKSHNIFIHEKNNNELEAKIGDWGSARALTSSGNRNMTHGVGTACWLAPEVIRNARYTQESDVYSFGILLWELATRDEVYVGYSAQQIIARVANDGLRPPVPRGCPWNDIMQMCWAEDPSSRPTFERIMEWLMSLLAKHKR